MAIEKDIAVHGSSGVGQCVDYILDNEKTDISNYEDTSSSNIDTLLDYAKNLEKTVFSLDGDKDILVTGIDCDKDNAANDFARTKEAYDDAVPYMNRRGSGGTKTVYNHKSGKAKTVAKESIEAYHVIQSFPALAGLDPKLVHQIGIEYAKASFPNHQCVVSTHMNTDNLHNHIVVCAYEMNHPKKLAMNKSFRRQIRHINDEISLKYGLPILIGNEIGSNISMSTNEYYAKASGTSYKDELREAITTALSKEYVTSWPDFIIQMENQGYKVRETPKNITYIKKYPGKNGNEIIFRCRENKLGPNFEKQNICRAKDWKVSSPTHYTYWETERLHDFKKASSKNDFVGNKEDERFHIHISRYDDNGHRRTDLEMLFLVAIKVIDYLWHRLIDQHKYRTIIPDKNHDPRIMIKTISDCMKLAKVMNIGSIKELTLAKANTGKNLSIYKKDLDNAKQLVASFSPVADKASAAKSLMATLSSYGITPDSFYITAPTRDIVRASNAKLSPMTANQRRELYLLMGKHEDKWKLGCKYENISFFEAKKIFDFLNGKTDRKPDTLITPAEFSAKREHLKEQAALGYPEKKKLLHEKDINDAAFEKLLASYPADVATSLSRCRTILQELSDLGYDVKSLDTVFTNYHDYSDALSQLKDKVSSLSSEYLGLCKLEDGIKMAKEHSFYDELIKDPTQDNKQTRTQDESIHISSESLDSYIGH